MTGRTRRAALAGVVAAAAALAATELVAAVLAGDQSPFVAVGDRVISVTPGPIVSLAIDLFGPYNRLVLLGSMLAVAGLAGAVIGTLARARPAVGPAGFAVGAAVGIAAALAEPLVTTQVAVVAPALGAVTGTLVLHALLRRAGQVAPAAPDPGNGPARSDPRDDPASPPLAGARSRRAFLTWTVSTAGVAAVAAGSAGWLQRRTATDAARQEVALPHPPDPLPSPPPAASFDVDGLSPLLTPNDRFYRIDTAFTVPRVDPATHAIRVTGMIDRPFELSYADLLAMADTEADVTLACVSNEVGGSLVGNARWFGVPLDRILDRAGVHGAADQIVGRSVDGWTGGFPVEAASDGRPALVAVGMNGEPLPPAHGFPVRLVIAGLYGYVSDTKWLEEIELTTFDAFDAYWIPRGWAREGPIKTQSRIDVPRPGTELRAGPVVVAGVAWAGERGIADVEVAVDTGPWQPAELAFELATTSWRQWRLTWDADPGSHLLRVRATDGEGHTQPSETTPPRPDGASGHHAVPVRVA